MSNKQNLINMLLFTLDEYSSYLEQLRTIPANQMYNFINTMEHTVKNWKDQINKYQTQLINFDYQVLIKRSSQNLRYEIIEIKNTNLDDINHKIKHITKQKESTKVKLINENSPDTVEYESDSEILSSSNNSDENKSNNIYNIFITRGNNCKEESNKCNHEIKHIMVYARSEGPIHTNQLSIIFAKKKKKRKIN